MVNVIPISSDDEKIDEENNVIGQLEFLHGKPV
jgi:hypothetical protein